MRVAAGGTDRVVASRSYALSGDSNVETLTTTGPTTTTVINLTGSNTANTILGNAAANALNGGGGGDVLAGFGGNDLYIVDNALDRRDRRGGQGHRYGQGERGLCPLARPRTVENLQTTNVAGTTAIDLTGSNLNNVITGNAGANVLKGLGGNDRLFALDSAGLHLFLTDVLYGGLGNDQLTGGVGRDTFVV